MISVPTCNSPTNKQTDDIKFITGEYVVGLFVDGYYPGEVVKSSKETVTIDFLVPVDLKQNYNGASLWKKTK